jgi:hypothetical protein
MFPGSPSPLRPNTLLRRLLSLARPDELLGLWVMDCRSPCLINLGRPQRVALLAASDLGYLLRRCGRVVVWDGEPVAMESTRLIRFRVLQIVLGTPYLPPPRQLRALYPALRAGSRGFEVPIGLGSAEEALGLCAAENLKVIGSRIAYHALSG